MRLPRSRTTIASKRPSSMPVRAALNAYSRSSSHATNRRGGASLTSIRKGDTLIYREKGTGLIDTQRRSHGGRH